MESRKFKPDENLIFHLIKSQSSTVETAMRELVQNAYDAEATSCHIEISQLEFSVSDDGRGFANRNEVEVCFETFGTPHATARDHNFGRFRMGRCQIMAFAPTNWLSNQFQMQVDIQAHGLEYKLREDCVAYPGCKIQGIWYTPLSAKALKSLLSDLRSCFEFFHRMPVWVNGVKVSKSLTDLAVTAESEDCYVIQDASRPAAAVYNLGIYVQTIGLEYVPWNVTGAIITKNHLGLDISRQYIDHDCPVWLRITKFLVECFPRPKRRGHLSSTQIEWHLREIYEGLTSIQELRPLKLFQNPARTHRYSLLDLAKCHSFTFATSPDDEVLADKIHQSGRTVVLSLRHLAKFSNGEAYNEQIYHFFDVLDELDIQNEYASEDDFLLIEQVLANYIPFNVASENFREEFGFLDEVELTLVERCAFKAIRSAQAKILHLAWKQGRPFTKQLNLHNRVLRVGYSTRADGWTDGSSFIAINRSLLKRVAQGMLKSEYIAAVIVHEWCHRPLDSGTHNAEFYRLYHDLTCNGQLDMLATFASHINRAYAQNLQQAGLSIPKAVVRYLTGELGQGQRDSHSLHASKKAKELATKQERALDDVKAILYATCEFLHSQTLDSLPQNLHPIVQMFAEHSIAGFMNSFEEGVDWHELVLNQYDYERMRNESIAIS